MDTKIVYLCAGCGINEAEKEESLCGDCIRKLMRLQVSWTKEDTVENLTILENTRLGDSYGINNTARF